MTDGNPFAVLDGVDDCTPTERIVLVALRTHETPMDAEALAEETDTPVKTVYQSVQSLADAGHVDVVNEAGGIQSQQFALADDTG